MCGRFVRLHTQAEIEEIMAAETVEGLGASWNIAPTQEVLVVGLREGRRVIRAHRWGLVPSWSKDAGAGPRCINARSETLWEKPSFRAAANKRRCVVPASGFYEWATRSSGKVPHYIRPRDGSLLAFAGVWESWRRQDGTELRTVAVITVAPCEEVRAIHDRMPAVLDREGVSSWLSPEARSEELKALLVPAPAGILEAWAVSPRVGSPRVNDPGLVEHWRAA